jgi:hypothetical protein
MVDQALSSITSLEWQTGADETGLEIFSFSLVLDFVIVGFKKELSSSEKIVNSKW